VQYHRPCGA